MMVPNTMIENILVDGQKAIAQFSSTNSQAKYEAMLDGWANWKPVPNPATFSGLNPGTRTLTVRAISRKGIPDSTPATKQFLIEAPAPPPPPQSNWQTVKTLSKVSDWSATLIEGLDGASITDVAGDVRYFIPGPQDGERCETQTYFGKEGQLCAYDYSFVIPSTTKLSMAYPNDPKNIITQHHGDKNAGYTGGVSVYPDGRISLRIKGGHEQSMSGSHPYEYEDEIFFGQFHRDTRHKVRLEIKWHRDSGAARAQIDGGAWQGVIGVPTWPLGDSDNDPTTQIMYRHGWYPQGHTVQGNMDIRFGPLTFQLGT
jgi:hypothetical protein